MRPVGRLPALLAVLLYLLAPPVLQARPGMPFHGHPGATDSGTSAGHGTAHQHLAAPPADVVVASSFATVDDVSRCVVACAAMHALPVAGPVVAGGRAAIRPAAVVPRPVGLDLAPEPHPPRPVRTA